MPHQIRPDRRVVESPFGHRFGIMVAGFVLPLGILFSAGCQPATTSSLQINRLIDEVESKASVDTLVICPKSLQPGLQAWVDYRTQQGRGIQVISPARDATSVSEQIKQVAARENLKYVFLVGDVGEKRNIAKLHRRVPNPSPSLDQTDGSLVVRSTNLNSHAVPTHYLPAKVNQNFGSEPEIPTDFPYSDLTSDGLPEFALGRLPANSVSEVRDYLARVMDYEQQPSSEQRWKRRINFVAGVGGFGSTIDSALEQVTKEIITGMIPADYEISMTLGSWRSPFCPDPRKFEQTVISKFNEGCQFLVYIGHGLPTELGKLRLPDREYSIFDCRSARKVKCINGSPIAILLACYTGAIDHQRECLSTALLRQPGGPIAVISSTRVSMPYGMSIMMLEFADKFFQEPPDTLGELLQLAKRNMVTKPSTSPVGTLESQHSQLQRLREMVQGTGQALSPSPGLLSTECYEHLYMMHLFGDPLLRLKKPEKIRLVTPETAKAGTRMLIRGRAPFSGKLCVELVYPRERFRNRPKYRRNYQGTDQEFARYQQAYERAHDQTCGVCSELVTAGPFELELPVPTDVSGECVIRCFLSNDDDICALGSSRLMIDRD